jgi:hypothetical protein
MSDRANFALGATNPHGQRSAAKRITAHLRRRGAAIGGPPRALGSVRCLFERPTDKSSPSGHRQRSVERLAAISHPIEHRCRFGTVAILKSRHGELSNRDMVRQKSTARAVKSRESRRFSSPTEIAYWQ